MYAQQVQLEEALGREGWKVVEREKRPAWWAKELWTIESVWRPVGRRLWIGFLTDPMDDGVDPRVLGAGLGSAHPTDRDDFACIVSIRGHWTEALQELLESARVLRDVG